jgi:hypothetical protein
LTVEPEKKWSFGKRILPATLAVALVGVGLIGGLVTSHFYSQSAHPPAGRSASALTTPLSQTPSASRSAAEGKIETVFSFDMIDSRIAYLESLVGPAKTSFDDAEGHMRTYVVDGCDVTVTGKDSIEAIKVSLGRGCQVSRSFIDGGSGPLSDMTFAQAEKHMLGGGGYQLDCYGINAETAPCGASTNPSATLTSSSVHATGWEVIQVEADTVDEIPGLDRAVPATATPEDLSKCGNPYQDLIRKGLADTKITAVTIRRDPDYGPDGCKVS